MKEKQPSMFCSEYGENIEVTHIHLYARQERLLYKHSSKISGTMSLYPSRKLNPRATFIKNDFYWLNFGSSKTDYPAFLVKNGCLMFPALYLALYISYMPYGTKHVACRFLLRDYLSLHKTWTHALFLVVP